MLKLVSPTGRVATWGEEGWESSHLDFAEVLNEGAEFYNSVTPIMVMAEGLAETYRLEVVGEDEDPGGYREEDVI